MSSSISDPQYEKMSLPPIPKLILGLSVPAIISMLVTNIYNLVDTAFGIRCILEYLTNQRQVKIIDGMAEQHWIVDTVVMTVIANE